MHEVLVAPSMDHIIAHHVQVEMPQSLPATVPRVLKLVDPLVGFNGESEVSDSTIGMFARTGS
jgi:hypothetical protein